jgi:hypothetical protein
MQPIAIGLNGGLGDDRMLLVFAMMTMTAGTATGPSAQTAIAGDQTPFTCQIDSMDANGALIASASGRALGDAAGCGRGYFYVTNSAQAAAYRAAFQRFDKVTPAASPPQAPRAMRARS